MSDTDQPETMTVTIRDRSKEAPLGSGMTSPCVRKVIISAFCPIDGQRRGEPVGHNEHDDGVWYWVQTWHNPCGHIDSYRDVVNEAAFMATDEAARYLS